MTDTTAPTSADRIRKIYAEYAGLYAPSVIEEAARFLDDLLDTAVKHGHNRTAEGLGFLAMAAAEATSGKYGHPATDRNHQMISALSRALLGEFTELGLTLAPARVRMGVAVEPMAGGPTWGMDGRTGLAVALYADSGWDLMVNQPQTRVYSICAPATVEGAREVAAIVHGVLHGDIEDPFRRR